MFDYKKFEDRLVLQMENTLAKLLKEHDDIYIFSLSLSSDADSVWVIANTIHNLEEISDPGEEEYYYYKYCEEEWDLWETDDFDSISDELGNYDVYEDEDEECDEEFEDGLYEITCPQCGEVVCVDEEMLESRMKRMAWAAGLEAYSEEGDRTIREAMEKLLGRPLRNDR